MAHKIIAFAAVQALIFQMAFSQVYSRFGGRSCGCNNILPVSEQLITGPFLSNGPNYIPAGPGYLPAPGNVLYDQPTTIIQDSTVANNLANALQLLVVSNLLSSTLPLEQSVPLAVPAGPLAPLELLPSAPLALAPQLAAPYASCGCGGCGCNTCGLSPYNIIY